MSQDLSSGSVVVKLERPLAPDAEVDILVQGTFTGGDSRGEILISPFPELE